MRVKNMAETQIFFEEWVNSKNKYDERKYTDAILGIVDILGFSQFVKIKNDDSTAPKKIIEIINDSIFINKLGLPENIKYKMLSDTFIVYSDEITVDNVYYVIYALENFRIQLLENGFLCRGALVRNKNYINNDIIVSEALIDAYRIESNIAKYPRIIVDMDIIKIIKPQMDSGKVLDDNKIIIKKRVIKDFDGEYIIMPFVGIADIAAFLYKDFHYFSYRNDPENEELFINTMSKFKRGLESCAERISTRDCINKLNYFINSYNKILKDAGQLLNASIKELYMNNIT